MPLVINSLGRGHTHTHTKKHTHTHTDTDIRTETILAPGLKHSSQQSQWYS